MLTRLRGKALLGYGGRLIVIALRHEVTLAGAHQQLSLLAFGIERFDAKFDFMHAAIVFLVLADGKVQVGTRGKVAEDLAERGAVITSATNVDGFTAGFLRQLFGAAVETDADPAGHGTSDGKQEFIERAQVGSQRIE